jgi:hypothetical protein
VKVTQRFDCINMFHSSSHALISFTIELNLNWRVSFSSYVFDYLLAVDVIQKLSNFFSGILLSLDQVKRFQLKEGKKTILCPNEHEQ